MGEDPTQEFPPAQPQLELSIKRIDRLEEELREHWPKVSHFQNELFRMQTRAQRLFDRFEKLENPPVP